MKENGDWYCYIKITTTSGNSHIERHAGTTTYADTFNIQMKNGETATLENEGGASHNTTYYFK